MPIHPRRPLAALVLVLSLPMAQWALALCVCPLEQRADAMEAMHAAELPCEEPDERQPALCHPHMEHAAPCAETAKTALPVLPHVTLMPAVPAPAVERGADAAAWAPRAAAQGPPAHPVYLATRRLRD